MRRVLKPSIRLTCRSSLLPLMLFVDRMQRDTILLDLCINARVAIGDRGTICVDASKYMKDAHAAGRDAMDLPPGASVSITVAGEGTVATLLLAINGHTGAIPAV